MDISNCILLLLQLSIHHSFNVSEICFKSVRLTTCFQVIVFFDDALRSLFDHRHNKTGASHRRFSHSIGVSYLAGQYAKKLQETLSLNPISRKEQQITEVDALCVQIAGLCHDLGHGPLSHTYDGQFVRQLRHDRTDWAHEHASADLLDHLIESNKGLREAFESYGLTDSDIHFIKELIFVRFVFFTNLNSSTLHTKPTTTTG